MGWVACRVHTLVHALALVARQKVGCRPRLGLGPLLQNGCPPRVPLACPQTGSETGVVLDGNLGILTRASNFLALSDTTPATFFFTNPNNTVTNNRAAGSDGSGFWYSLRDRPTGAAAAAGAPMHCCVWMFPFIGARSTRCRCMVPKCSLIMRLRCARADLGPCRISGMSSVRRQPNSLTTLRGPAVVPLHETSAGQARPYRTLCPKYTPLDTFQNNVGHSSLFFGLRIYPEFYPTSVSCESAAGPPVHECWWCACHLAEWKMSLHMCM